MCVCVLKPCFSPSPYSELADLHRSFSALHCQSSAPDTAALESKWRQYLRRSKGMGKKSFFFEFFFLIHSSFVYLFLSFLAAAISQLPSSRVLPQVPREPLSTPVRCRRMKITTTTTTTRIDKMGKTHIFCANVSKLHSLDPTRGTRSALPRALPIACVSMQSGT